MDSYQLKTFVAVAREGSVTRASQLLHLSQPAVSAHIKALEDALGLTLFERTARGMSLTPDGQRLLVKAEQTLAAHRDLMAEAARIKGGLSGKLRLGASTSSSGDAVGDLLMRLSERWPDVDVTLEHATSNDILVALRNGSLDAGFYNESGEPGGDLTTVEVSRFAIYLVAPRGRVPRSPAPDWPALAELPWVYPTSSACCGRAAEGLFASKGMRPKRIISVDRENVTRTLITGGVGVGLLHEDTAEEAEARGEVDVLFRSAGSVRVLFAHLASRAADPLVGAAMEIMRGQVATRAPSR